MEISRESCKNVSAICTNSVFYSIPGHSTDSDTQ